MTKEEIKNYLINEAEYAEEVVEQMVPFQLVDAYLNYKGIYGYTEDIVDVVRHAFGDMADDEDIEDILYNDYNK